MTAFSAIHKYYCTGSKSDISAASLTTLICSYKGHHAVVFLRAIMTVEHTGIWLYSFSLAASFIPGRARRKDLDDSWRLLSEGCTTKKQVGARILYFFCVV